MSSRDRKPAGEFVWREVIWPHPFTPDVAVDLLTRVAADRTLGRIVLETHATRGRVRYLIGVRSRHLDALLRVVEGIVTGVRVLEPQAGFRVPLLATGRVSVSRPSLSLNIERMTATSRAVHAGLVTAQTANERVVVQVVLGPRVAPRTVPTNIPEPTNSWLDLLRGSIPPVSPETRSRLRARASLHGFAGVLRVGAVAASPEKARGLILAVTNGLRVAEAAGAHLRLTIENPLRLHTAALPWRVPLRLSARETAMLCAWPLTTHHDEVLPGHPDPHPKVAPPPPWLQNHPRPFARTTAPGDVVAVGMNAGDSLYHTLLLGPTGAGKSNTLLTLVMDAVTAGRGLVVIDPKTDLVNDILARIPPDRQGDVVVIDPTDDHPVGINPFTTSARSPELTADAILAVFKGLFADSWGPRTQDVLTSALMTLAHHPGATLTMLPALLTDPSVRRSLTASLTDVVGLGTFWASYEAMSVEQQAQVIAPVMNKLRQFLLRPDLRVVLGQSDPLFRLEEVFTKRRIVLVALNKGLIGAESARLLGSLIVSTLWPLTLARAALPAERRHIVSVFIDEVQDYLALPTDLADALAQARGLGVGFTLAHQYRAQLPPNLRAGVDANTRNKIIFGLGATDAAEMAKQTTGLDGQDFMLLPRYHVYATLMAGGHSTGWFSAATLPARPATGDPIGLRVQSSQRYGRTRRDVERDVLEAIGLTPTSEPGDNEFSDTPVGRRRRTDQEDDK